MKSSENAGIKGIIIIIGTYYPAILRDIILSPNFCKFGCK